MPWKSVPVWGMAVPLVWVWSRQQPFSRQKGWLTSGECQRISRILTRLHLPTTHTASVPDLLEDMTRDKKKQDDAISFVFLKGIGHAVVEKISLEDLRALFCNPLMTWRDSLGRQNLQAGKHWHWARVIPTYNMVWIKTQ